MQKKGTAPPWLQAAAKSKLAAMDNGKPGTKKKKGKHPGFVPGKKGVNPFAKK
jgi:hypothetical protein